MLQSKFSHIGIFFPLQHFQASLMLVLLAPYVFSHPKSLFVPATGLWSLPHRFPVGLFPAQGSVFQVNIILFPAKILCAGSFLTVFNWEQLPKSCVGVQLLFFGPVIPAFFGSFLPACESRGLLIQLRPSSKWGICCFNVQISSPQLWPEYSMD